MSVPRKKYYLFSKFIAYGYVLRRAEQGVSYPFFEILSRFRDPLNSFSTQKSGEKKFNPEKKKLIRRKKFNPEKLRRKIINPEKLRRKKINPEKNWRRKERKIPNPDSEGNIRRNFGEKLLPIQGNSGENGEKVEKMEKIRRRLDPVEYVSFFLH